ncbi:MAG: hypothetical protein KME13_19025 [Myxacorys californica WJT36-NPBG1]|jgi:hypothetical protein|nr:hypothetical protein [Myxacorys californica WJT36-NPBG1]
MFITDLDHLVYSPDNKSIVGSSLASNSLVLNLNNQQLILRQGDTELFQTTLPQSPSGIQLSYEQAPGFAVSINSNNENGGFTASSTVVGVATQSSGLTPISFWGLLFNSFR